ncbi:MAG: 1-propanol dehydrogenase PduQ [Candidatus Limivivens sp.]|nr:1-propanol dehydrogenase PduQ [Candidatus Limivivens sp.]
MEAIKIETEIYFGADALDSLDGICGNRVFLVTDPFLVQSGLAGLVTKRLQKRQYQIFDKVVPDPPLEAVSEGVQEVLKFQPDTVVALGGGSAIDEAKAILFFARETGQLGTVKLTAVPTTSGTGSEVTSFAVITDKSKGVKYPLVDPSLLPDAAILDVELVKSLPVSIAADTGMDVLTHALEAYVSPRANAFTDALARSAAVTVLGCLVRSCEDPGDLEAREQMLYASCMAGLAFDRTSLGLNHALAHNIGGKFPIPHGRANAVLLPYVVEYNADLGDYSRMELSEAARKYGALAKFAGIGGNSVRISVKNLIREIRKMEKRLKMPTTFRECGISSEEFFEKADAVAEGALADRCILTNPRTAKKEDILELLRKSYHHAGSEGV